jgi:hypothetical protein
MDIFVLGPLMVYWATKKDLTNIDKSLLIFFGATTVYYNANNYLKNRAMA